MSYAIDRLKLIGYADKTRFEEISEVEVGKRPWPFFGAGIVEYYDEYRSLLLQSNITFNDLIYRHYDKNRNVYFADICGDGQLVREHPFITRGVGLTLYDDRDESKKEADYAQGLAVMEGDLLDRSTWDVLREYCDLQGIRGYDFMIMRPYGGWYALGYKSLYYDFYAWQHLNNCFQLLNPDRGTLLFSLLNDKNKGFMFKRWVERLKQHQTEDSGYAVSSTKDTQKIMIERLSPCVTNLPLITGSGG